MQRRELIGGAAAAMSTAAAAKAAPLADIPIIDTHVHLFDSRRPQGVPYAGSPAWKRDMNGVALPSTYDTYAQPLNIVGAIELEASPWVEDNLWVLEQIQTDTRFVGTVGDLEPEKPDFPVLFDRFRKNPLFLGIRCGNIWGRDIAKQIDDPKFIDGLKRVADADAVMDSANQVSADVDGQAWSQQPFPYQAKCLGWLRQAHEDLPATARAQADAALGPAGLSGLFA